MGERVVELQSGQGQHRDEEQPCGDAGSHGFLPMAKTELPQGKRMPRASRRFSSRRKDRQTRFVKPPGTRYRSDFALGSPGRARKSVGNRASTTSLNRKNMR